MSLGLVVELVDRPPLGPLVAVVAAGRVERLLFDQSPDAVGAGEAGAAGAHPHDTGPHDAGPHDTDPHDLAVVAQLRAGVTRWLASGEGQFEVPLDLDEVGPFRAAVYEALRAVPAGASVTYGELAVRAGYPGAARAVGGAMASNPWPLIVPCHRVLPAGGGVGNYAGGAGRKAWMLAVEAAGGAAQAGP